MASLHADSPEGGPDKVSRQPAAQIVLTSSSSLTALIEAQAHDHKRYFKWPNPQLDLCTTSCLRHGRKLGGHSIILAVEGPLRLPKSLQAVERSHRRLFCAPGKDVLAPPEHGTSGDVVWRRYPGVRFFPPPPLWRVCENRCGRTIRLPTCQKQLGHKHKVVHANNPESGFADVLPSSTNAPAPGSWQKGSDIYSGSPS